MNRELVEEALENGDFSGVSHKYEPYSGHNKHTTYQITMEVVGSTIEVTKTTRSKFFDGKENEWSEEDSTEYLSGSDAVDFIEKRPYYFKQVRPDLF